MEGYITTESSMKNGGDYATYVEQVGDEERRESLVKLCLSGHLDCDQSHSSPDHLPLFFLPNI